MVPSLEALKYWNMDDNGSYYLRLPTGIEIWLERLLFDGQYYLAVYDDNLNLIGEKVCVKLGK